MTLTTEPAPGTSTAPARAPHDEVDVELDPDRPWAPDRRYKPRLASRWLSPRQLVDAGIKQLLAGLFETYADRRDSMQTRDGAVLVHPDVAGSVPPDLAAYGLTARPLFPGESRRPGTTGELWFDFVADVGDGFSATYTVAAEIAMTGVPGKVKDYPGEPGEAPVTLRRGDLLIMGGDEVYPLASDVEYRNRTIGPYETACRRTDPPLALLAVPGNHDWYDGLSAYLARFCTEQWIGGWNTRQSRSYWAAHVQPGWWIWGIDIALERAPIDHHQHRYFSAVAAQLAPGDRIILVTAKPSWLAQDRAPLSPPTPEAAEGGPGHAYEQLSYFMATTLEAALRTDEHREKPPRFVLVLSGDKHFYCRYDNDSVDDNDSVASDEGHDDGAADGSAEHRLPHVVAGGGGAYLSLPFRQAETRALHRRQPRKARAGATADGTTRPDAITLHLERRRQWPEPAATRMLAVSALWKMITRNWGFCAVLAGVYLLLAKIIQAGFPGDYTSSWGGDVVRTFEALVAGPGQFLTGVGLWGALMLRSSLPYTRRALLAAAQAALHLVALSTAATLARMAVNGWGLSPVGWSAAGLAIVAAAWGGWGLWIWRLYRKVPRPAVAGFGVLAAAAVAVAWPGTWWDGWVAPESLAWTVALTGIGSLVAGVAFAAGLLVAVGLFGEQDNDLSVAVRESGYKNFLRLHIDGDCLHVYAIGIEKIPHQRLRFRSEHEPHAGTPEVITCRLPARNARYQPRIIDQFTVR